jgi:hypothetical protein
MCGNRKTFATLAVVLSATVLAGCSAEPSQGDIETAVANEQKAMPKIMEGLVPQVTVLKKVGCKPDGEKAFLCDLEVSAKQFGNQTQDVVPLRLVKGSNGWVTTKRAGS